MALRLMAMECIAACSAVSRRAMHSSASTSSLTAALQRSSASTPSEQARGALAQLGRRSFATDGPSLQTYKDYSDDQIREIEARVFGMHLGDGLPSGRKVLRQKLVGEKVVDWYPEDLTKNDPYMLNIKAEKAKLKLDRLRRRGKAPPKKGAGKRSSKR